MEGMLGLVRGFVDILVLAGGRTYSGAAAATRRSGDVKKALRWALFFEEKDILEYATQSLESKPYILWLLHPVLTATAMLPRSTLFEIYLAEIDKEFNEAASTNRGDGIEQHHNCEIAERIQCLYTFHIQQPHLVVQ